MSKYQGAEHPDHSMDAVPADCLGVGREQTLQRLVRRGHLPLRRLERGPPAVQDAAQRRLLPEDQQGQNAGQNSPGLHQSGDRRREGGH